MMAWYERALARLPLACETQVLRTRFGATHALAAGPAGAPPVVLLHGLNANALMWSGQLAALAGAYRVYALDIVGTAGRSAPRRLPYDSRTYAQWLGQALDALAVPAASFVGFGLGAWLILRLAGVAPERLQRAALLSPAGLLPVRWKYLIPILWDVLYLNDDQAQRLARQLLAPPGAPLDAEAVEMLFLNLKHCQPHFEAPGLTPAQIGQLRVPTLVLAGEHEDTWSPRELLAAARVALPDLRAAEIVPGAGHGLTASHSAWVSDRLLRFLQTEH